MARVCASTCGVARVRERVEVAVPISSSAWCVVPSSPVCKVRHAVPEPPVGTPRCSSRKPGPSLGSTAGSAACPPEKVPAALFDNSGVRVRVFMYVEVVVNIIIYCVFRL